MLVSSLANAGAGVINRNLGSILAMTMICHVFSRYSTVPQTDVRAHSPAYYYLDSQLEPRYSLMIN